jgi:hypothetical protein
MPAAWLDARKGEAIDLEPQIVNHASMALNWGIAPLEWCPYCITIQ